ncbi:MAG: MFS transporter [Clostridia bacterium]|nr:MFS transporter [Clostridia bacterium]
MKLDYKKTILVGFAFFIISAFWQAYDKTIPMLMTYKFNMSQLESGIIMALDNILAVFMLPLFGMLSDKTKTRFGRRTPFIVIGTICAIVAFIFIPLIGNIVLFIAILLVTLIAMATFRSPAVALMPDVTCKPHRSKGNAIINLMGTAGGLLILVLGMVIKVGKEHMSNFFPYYIAACGIMLLGLIVFILTVREPKWAKEMQENTEKYFPDNEAEERNTTAGGKLTKSQLVSLLLILASVALWYMGYNAITSKYSLYADSVLNQSYDLTLMIAQAGAIIAYIPVGMVASKIGRKKTILAGVAMLATAFFVAIFMTSESSPIFMYILFAIAGIGWATINVNSFPMVVELAKEGDVGKYTGWYYTASMSAQVITPILSGGIMDLFGNMSPLFPYASICVALAFITMFFVKHGDSKPTQPKDKFEALAGADD